MTTNNKNGSGNGHDKDNDPNIVRFPTLVERDRKRRADKQATELALKAQRSANKEPMLNWHKIPPFARFYAASIIIVHVVLSLIISKPDLWEIQNNFGFVPAHFTGGEPISTIISYASPITHMFIHGSWMHLLFNVIMGLVFCIFFERLFSPKTTAIFFTLCGVLGALTFLLFSPFSSAPLIGASGGVSGLFGAAIVLMHSQGQLGMFKTKPLWQIIVFWSAFMVITGIISGDNVAWQSHLGGFLGGIGILHLMRAGKLRI